MVLRPSLPPWRLITTRVRLPADPGAVTRAAARAARAKIESKASAPPNAPTPCTMNCLRVLMPIRRSRQLVRRQRHRKPHRAPYFFVDVLAVELDRVADTVGLQVDHDRPPLV